MVTHPLSSAPILLPPPPPTHTHTKLKKQDLKRGTCPNGDDLYVAGVSEANRYVCRKFGVKVMYESRLTRRSMLTRVKEALPLEKKNSVSCTISCVAVVRSILGRSEGVVSSSKACMREPITKQLGGDISGLPGQKN